MTLAFCVAMSLQCQPGCLADLSLPLSMAILPASVRTGGTKDLCCHDGTNDHMMCILSPHQNHIRAVFVYRPRDDQQCLNQELQQLLNQLLQQLLNQFLQKLVQTLLLKVSLCQMKLECWPATWLVRTTTLVVAEQVARARMESLALVARYASIDRSDGAATMANSSPPSWAAILGNQRGELQLESLHA